MQRHLASFDFILNTVAAPHNLDAYLELLKRDGTLCLVGAPENPHPAPNVFNLIFKRRRLAGSLIGGLRETQEMLDFCAEHGIVADIELIPIQRINEAYERMLRSDVKYRFVIDMASLKPETASSEYQNDRPTPRRAAVSITATGRCSDPPGTAAEWGTVSARSATMP